MDFPQERSGIRSAAASRVRALMVGLAAAGGLLLFAAASSTAVPPSVTASFTFTPASPRSGQTVRFTSTSTVTGKSNAIVDHRWDLDGNGTFETDTGASNTASRAYALPGSVTVWLQVTGQGGRTSVASNVVNIGNRPPVASFTYSPSPAIVGEPITFTSTAGDPEGQIADLAWDLNGDGIYDNGRGRVILRSFDRAGSYVVGLRVTDRAGAVVFSSRAITVVAPSAAFGGTAGQGSKPGLRLMNPFPVVRIVGRITSRGTLLRLLRVDAPAGAKVLVRCSGRSCPFRKQVRVAVSAAGARPLSFATAARPEALAAKVVRLRRLERLLRPGARITIFVTRPDAIGKYTRFRIRRGKPPARADRCLRPGSSRPVRCPAA
jgi:PKD repeat protein